MAAAGLFNKPFFISVEELLRIECIETFDELCEFYMSEKNTGIDARLMMILSNTYMCYDQKRHTRVQIVDFWKSVDQLGLHYMYVQNGVLIYKQPWVQNNCSAWLNKKLDFHQEMISFENHDVLFMENQCFPWSTVVEASDQAQDWISQEMVKPHVRVMKEKLNFTDVQIVNGLQILRERDEEITFMGLLNTLVPTENALLNVYVGTGKFAFSADIKLVLRHCYAKYHREPTQEEFELEWNRIKEHLMEQVDLEKTRANRTEEEKMRAEEEKMRAEEEKMRAEEEKMRAEEEKLEALNREAMLEEEKRRAEEEKMRAEEEKMRAEEEKMRAEEEKMRAEEEKLEALNREAMLKEEKMRAEEEKMRAEEEKMRAEEEKLVVLRDYNNAIEVRNEAVDEIIQGLNREEVLKKEKDDERAKAEAERAKAEAERAKAEAERAKAETERANAKAERAKAEMLEKQLAKMTALFEKEKKQLLLQIQQMTGCVRA
ncbi:golgin subfamily A member 6-like protein 22 isoform X2 [Pecten maximus]|uniref:golgin subfamily A member 6-like protein 22 isoform X2 n=1 Tax=Pecten maximus TaxID=6579 RepID=UPI00145874C5|nr:golgin subfamily A member 6-like protein 22 isoform X2 [Pecten maximus]